MGFNSTRDAVKIVGVKLTYGHLYVERDDKGAPVPDPETGRPKPCVFTFPVVVSRERDRQLEETERALGGGRKMQPEERLAELIAEPSEATKLGYKDGMIEGFDDVPREGDYRENIRKYFGRDAEMRAFAEDALSGRVNSIYPTQLFRGV